MPTKKTKVSEIKRSIVPVLKAMGIVKAGLFGSAARDELRPSSDIDLLIETNGKLNLFEFVGLKQNLETRLARRVDLVEYSALKPSLKKKILAEQISIL